MKTIFITGGSRGIGEAVVRAAATEYNVAFSFNKSADRAAALAKELGAFAVQADVSDSASVDAAVKKVEDRFGGIDLLVNNAGVSSSGLLQDVSDGEWRRIFAVNCDGTFYVTRAVLPYMIKKQRGAIVNVSSIWGRVGGSCEAAYSASKAAVIGLTKALAKEVAPSNITVNAVAPGAIDTDMMKVYSSEDVKALEYEIPLGRLGTPGEVASAVMFLLQNPYVTGQVLGIDGGLF